MQPGPDGYASAAVVNRAAGLGVWQRYQPSALPHHITWRQLGTGSYVVAMEPSTNRDACRFDARTRGELGHLPPGGTRRYSLEVGALVGPAAIDAFTAGARAAAAATCVTRGRWHERGLRGTRRGGDRRRPGHGRRHCGAFHRARRLGGADGHRRRLAAETARSLGDRASRWPAT